MRARTRVRLGSRRLYVAGKEGGWVGAGGRRAGEAGAWGGGGGGALVGKKGRLRP